MKMKFDYHELEKFADNLLTESRDKELQLLIRKLAGEFLYEAARSTPVVTGQMRNRWFIDNVNLDVRKVKEGYSVTLYNNATNKYGYKYARDVDQGHQSYNQYGGPYVVHHSKYGKNGGAVIGRFIVEKAHKKSEKDIQKDVAHQLQKWLDRCVENAK